MRARSILIALAACVAVSVAVPRPAGSQTNPPTSPFVNPAGHNEKSTHATTAYKTSSKPPPPNRVKISYTEELGTSKLHLGADYKIGWEGGAQQGSFKNVKSADGNPNKLTADILAPAITDSGDPWGHDRPVIGTATFTLTPGPWDPDKTPQVTFEVTTITDPGTSFRLKQGDSVILYYACAPSKSC